MRRLQHRPAILESETLELVLARAQVARALQHASAASAYGSTSTCLLFEFGVLGEELLVKVLLISVT
jgi:hypothetical protein